MSSLVFLSPSIHQVYFKPPPYYHSYPPPRHMVTSDGFLSGQVYRVGRVGLDTVHSLTRAMDFSFLTSLFSGTDLASTTFPEGVRLFLLGTIIESGRRFCYWAFERFRIRWSITAQFDEGDPACEWLINYFTEDVWKQSREFLVSAKSSQLRWGIKMCSSIESAEYVPKYNNKPYSFRWKGYWIEIQRTESSSSLLLTMYTLDIEALSNLVEEARLKYIEGRRPHVTIVHSIDLTLGDTWNVVTRKNRRPLESIILPEGFLSTLVKDVKNFLQTENWYMRAGIPYRRGYLLFGPPGTGKTSTIYALAGELGLEIYTISLSSGFVDDNMLQRAISSLPKHSIFLLEDIDCAFPSREEGEEEERMMKRGVGGPAAAWAYPHANKKPVINVTMSGLLNVLDSVGSEDGKLFFATTNYVDRLDPALLRPGRINYRVEYKLATKAQAVALFNRFYPRRDSITTNGSASTHADYTEKQWDGTLIYSTSNEKLDRLSVEFALYLPDNEFTTAELQGYLLLHREDPREAVKNVAKWAESERAEKERRKEAEAEAARKAKLVEQEKLAAAAEAAMKAKLAEQEKLAAAAEAARKAKLVEQEKLAAAAEAARKAKLVEQEKLAAAAEAARKAKLVEQEKLAVAAEAARKAKLAEQEMLEATAAAKRSLRPI